MHTAEELTQIAIDHFNNGKPGEAASIVEMLCEKDPSNPAYPYLLGSAYLAMKRDGLAIPLLAYSANLNPSSPCLNNLGIALRHAGHDEAALLAYQKAIELDPKNPDAYVNTSGYWVNQGNPDECIKWSLKALEMDPDNWAAKSHYAIALLEKGDWINGWVQYTARYHLPSWTKRDYGCQLWIGNKVQRLAIHGEQGIGDEVLFLSFFDKVRHLADEIVIECEPRLVPLFERSFGVKCYGTHEELMASGFKPDAYIPMGSIPMLVGPLPNKRAYLKPDSERVKHYRERLEALGPGPYIGIAWKGGTKTTHAHLRSPGAEPWIQLAKSPAQFVSLQYGEAGAGHKVIGVPHWQEAINDLDEFAALLKALDLVITVCNSTVHFAGAVGAKCWVLTPSKPAWRYGIKGDSMPWYPNVRLFRQKDGWGDVFKQIGDALADFRRVPEAEQAAA